MTIDLKFLFDNELINEVEKLIRNSKNRLLIISPFIDLDKRIKDALNEKIERTDFELKVLFGKNENNIYKSVKKDSIKFLKQFPNVEIRYNERLHAKFYMNDTDFIMTSLNLYDYSLAKNIEVGIIVNYAAKGIVGKVLDGTESILNQGVSKIKQDVFGIENNETDPISRFEYIFDNSEIKYKSEATLRTKKGVKGWLGSKEIEKLNIEDNLVSQPKYNKKEDEQISNKVFSASKLAQSLGTNQKNIIELMEIEGLILEDKITELGKLKGLVIKKYMGKEYIAYPEDLNVLKTIRNT